MPVRITRRAVLGAALFAILVLVVSFIPFALVDAGHVGVVLHFGAVQDEVLPEGLHVIDPIGTDIVEIDSRIQVIEARATASSRDLQNVSSIVALNYAIDSGHAHDIFQDLGPDFERTIVAPAIQESVKAATAQFTAEELITRRHEVKRSIFASIRERLMRHHLDVIEFSIVDFTFSEEFNRAIEAKQVAEQAALRAKNDLDRVKTEAEQARARAEGQASAKLSLARAEAESQLLLRETLTPEILRLRAIEKWNGEAPTIVGESAGAYYDVFKGGLPDGAATTRGRR